MVKRHPRAGLRDRWVDHVVRADVGNACKVVLLYFAHCMNDHGKVEVISRSDLSARLHVHEQRIAERIAEARAAGLLDLVPGSGVRGVRAQYVAVLAEIRTAERYPLRTAEAERIETLSGTHFPGESDRCVPVSGTHNARAYLNAPTPTNLTTVGDATTSSSKDGSDGRAPAVVPLAAIPLDQRVQYTHTRRDTA